VKQNNPDLPGKFVFTLEPGAPTGMTINPATGLLSWSPGSNQTGSFHVTVILRDTQKPLNSDASTFQVVVQPINSNGAAITGEIFTDLNVDGHLTVGEPGSPGQTVYLDTNNDGVLDFGETTAITNGSGQ
jgi:hypothetical protein